MRMTCQSTRDSKDCHKASDSNGDIYLFLSLSLSIAVCLTLVHALLQALLEEGEQRQLVKIFRDATKCSYISPHNRWLSGVLYYYI